MCINLKIGLGNKSGLLELGGRGSSDITGVTNKDYWSWVGEAVVISLVLQIRIIGGGWKRRL